jgi:hypothetical protein
MNRHARINRKYREDIEKYIEKYIENREGPKMYLIYYFNQLR